MLEYYSQLDDPRSMTIYYLLKLYYEKKEESVRKELTEYGIYL